MCAVIFDLDGVLVRTDQAHDKAWRALAGRLGIPFDGRAAARLRGVSRMEALGVSPAEALVVEDAAAGVRAARCGGFSSAALGPAAAAEGLADHEIRSLPELLELV